MIKFDDIPTGELFKDFQITLVEIKLCERAIKAGYDYHDRLQSNYQEATTIQDIIETRFTIGEIIGFLENGYPRATVLESTF